MSNIREIVKREMDTDELVDSVVESVVDWLHDQPYSVECTECGKSLEYNVNIDHDNDMIITIEPCATCMEEAEEAGRSEGGSE